MAVLLRSAEDRARRQAWIREAVTELERAGDRCPDLAGAFFWLGRARGKVRSVLRQPARLPDEVHARAMREVEAALAIDPAFPMALFFRRQLRICRGEVDAGREDLRKFVRLYPAHVCRRHAEEWLLQ